MSGAFERDSLLRISTILDLLDMGWRPGYAELDAAPYVEKWQILLSFGGIPFNMIGVVWRLPVRSTIFVAPVLAIDPGANWARIWDEWVVIDASLDPSPAFDAAAIHDATAAWLHGELRRLPA